jgi:hypothetical protein
MPGNMGSGAAKTMRFRRHPNKVVMPGLVPGIHELSERHSQIRGWPGLRPPKQKF